MMGAMSCSFLQYLTSYGRSRSLYGKNSYNKNTKKVIMIKKNQTKSRKKTRNKTKKKTKQRKKKRNKTTNQDQKKKHTHKKKSKTKKNNNSQTLETKMSAT